MQLRIIIRLVLSTREISFQPSAGSQLHRRLLPTGRFLYSKHVFSSSRFAYTFNLYLLLSLLFLSLYCLFFAIDLNSNESAPQVSALIEQQITTLLNLHYSTVVVVLLQFFYGNFRATYNFLKLQQKKINKMTIFATKNQC